MAETREAEATRPYGVSVVMARLARSLGCTSGQAYSLVIALAVGLVLAGGGLPATLRGVPSVETGQPSLGAAPIASEPAVADPVMAPDAVVMSGAPSIPVLERSSPAATALAAAPDERAPITEPFQVVLVP